MSLLTKDIEETHRAALELGILDSELGKSLLNEAGEFSDLAYARKVAFHVRHKTGNTGLTEGLCQYLKGHGLTCTGSTGDESMTVRHFS